MITRTSLKLNQKQEDVDQYSFEKGCLSVGMKTKASKQSFNIVCTCQSDSGLQNWLQLRQLLEKY